MLMRALIFSLALSFILHAELSAKTNEDWTDEDLKELVMTGKKGIIYSWSPTSPYSVLEMPRFEKLAKRLGYEFTAVVDPEADKEEVEAALEMMNKKNLFGAKRKVASITFRRNVASDIAKLGDTDHFPVMYIYGRKKINPRPITTNVNIKSDKDFRATIRNYAIE